MPMKPIKMSIFDLFKVGPGPSSSHTIAPMKAGYNFIHEIRHLPKSKLARGARVTVHLYGSLSATGRGHRTDHAILAGLLNHSPERCAIGFLSSLSMDPSASYTLEIGSNKIPFSSADIIFSEDDYPSDFSNTLVISLLEASGHVLFEREYYSVGGGFLQWKGSKSLKIPKPVYPFACMSDVQHILTKKKIRLAEMMIENEKAITGVNEDALFSRIDYLYEIFEKTVDHGLKTEGVLPGKLHYHRRASGVYRHARRSVGHQDHIFLSLMAYALAAAEENANGEPVVTAPTCGSFGTMAGTIFFMRHHLKIDHATMQDALLAAALVGMLAKSNASIAGADVGCQGEIGVAASMAAAMLSYAKTSDSRILEHAAEKALEHHLGMTCDPVLGYVQIPCIERNAFGAVKAYTSYLLAIMEQTNYPRIGLDDVIEVLYETGCD